MSLSDDQNAVISNLLFWISLLSLFSNVFIIIVFLLCKEIRSFGFRLIIYLTINEVFYSVGLMLNEESLCTLQAIVLQYTSFCEILWSSIIAYSLYCVMVLGNEAEKLELRMLLIGYLVPVVFLCLPFITDSYGDAQGWCWIRDDGDQYIWGVIWRVVCFYLPLFVVITYNTFALTKVIKEINQEFAYMGEESGAKSFAYRLTLYPVVLIVSYSIVFIKRIFDFLNPDDPNYVLTVIATVTMCMTGTLNAFVYGFTETVREAIKRKLCCKPYVDIPEEALSLARRRSIIE